MHRKKDQRPLAEGSDPYQTGAIGCRPTCRSFMVLIGKNPGFGSAIDIFTAIELSIIISMEILDGNVSP